MGTDIHMYVEKRVDGKWQLVRDLPCSYWRHDNPSIAEQGVYQDYKDCYYCKGTGRSLCGYSARNYDVFAILADVRNGDSDTGDGFVPLSKPRGLPKDTTLTEEYPRDENAPWLGDHSFSYCTIAELQAYDWMRTTTKHGWVNMEEYKVWKEKGQPKAWSGGVLGVRITDVTHAQMEKLIAGESKELSSGGIPYTSVSWVVSYKEQAANFLRWLERLSYLTKEVGPANVRLVFGFDS